MAQNFATDAMIRRLQKELEERNSACQALIANAQDSERDLNESETETLQGLRNRMTEIRSQLTELESTAEIASQVNDRMKQFDQAMTAKRKTGSAEVEYRSAGAYAVDAYKSAMGDRAARERLEVFERAADHLKTGDVPGVVPDPIVGSVLNFIDAARPIVSLLGPLPLPAASWHRPKVTQHTSVAAQGAAGAAADEKTELVSQKMTITRLDASAVTYGGYVNVSRQSIDLGSGVMDAVVNDLAAQYSIETEAATADALLASGTTPVDILSTATADEVAAALWGIAGTIYNATRGMGRLVLAVSPDRLGVFGPLFAPVNPRDAQSQGFNAGQFGQGALGQISGVSLIMSGGLTGNEAVMFSTSAAEVYEQRVGTLQVTEPSVLGTQVGYAGYFTPLLVENGGVVPITQSA